MTLKPGCEHCEHLADVRGIDLTQPTPEAVEAVARQVCHEFCEGCREDSEAILAFIRDALHRDGPDADAIRDALGLRVNDSWVPVSESGARWVRRSEREARFEMENWPKGVTYSDGAPGDGITHIVKERCVTSNWREVQS